MPIVAMSNSLFETTDESCPLIFRIPTVIFVDSCENCPSFCHKNGQNWYFSGLPFMVSDNWHFSGFYFMMSDNSTFISQLEVNMFHTNM